jgi:hypothetical protein
MLHSLLKFDLSSSLQRIDEQASSPPPVKRAKDACTLETPHAHAAVSNDSPIHRSHCRAWRRTRHGGQTIFRFTVTVSLGVLLARCSMLGDGHLQAGGDELESL